MHCNDDEEGVYGNRGFHDLQGRDFDVLSCGYITEIALFLSEPSSFHPGKDQIN